MTTGRIPARYARIMCNAYYQGDVGPLAGAVVQPEPETTNAAGDAVDYVRLRFLLGVVDYKVWVTVSFDDGQSYGRLEYQDLHDGKLIVTDHGGNMEETHNYRLFDETQVTRWSAELLVDGSWGYTIYVGMVSP